MKFNPDLHHRRSVRLRGYDYSQAGAYWVTIDTQDRECLFGEIENGHMRLNGVGHMIEHWWGQLPLKFSPTVKTDYYVVMPNHFRGIIVIESASPVTNGVDTQIGANTQVRPYGLPHILQWFKTMTTNAYFRGVKEDRWQSVNKRLWQRNYYEHIIRDEADLQRIREYISNNPSNWDNDDDNPARWNLHP